ncbi:MAG: phage/plasmid primase, P4 family [Trueperaceae bacterium]|nr:phage/plasmid primase, P4 family [Trueperaceae bacterium]
MTAPHDAARRYIAGGFVLCPIPHGKKGPVTKQWQTIERCLTTADDLPSGASNFGLVHEHSGTVALDIDDPDAARVVFAEHGLDLDQLIAGSSYAVETARGVKPLYRVEGMTPPRTYQHLDLDKRVVFELRGSGGQDVLPPSLHPDGHVYRWRGGLEPAHRDDLDPLPMGVLTLWIELQAAKRPAPTPESTRPERTRVVLPDDREQRRQLAYLEAALTREATQLRTIPEGGRNLALNKAAHGLWGYVPTLEDAGIDTTEVEGMIYTELQDAARAAGLSEVEANKTLASASTSGRANPRTIPPPRHRPTSAPAPTSAAPPAHDGPDDPDDPDPAPDDPDPYPLDGLEPRLDLQPGVVYRNSSQHYRFDDATLLRVLGYPERIADVAGLSTDVALSNRVLFWSGGDLRYNEGLGWLVFDGRRWERSEDKATTMGRRGVGMLRREARAARCLAAQTDSSDMKEALQSGARKLDAAAAARGESLNAVKNALAFVRADVSTDTDRFKIAPFRLTFSNGVWDRGSFRPHDRDDLTLSYSPVEYDPDVDRTAWHTVLERITGGDADLAKTVQHVCGYALSGHSNLRTIPWFYGPKATGKSTLSLLLQTVLGDECRTLDTADFRENSSRNRLGASLFGKRVAMLPEASGTALSNDLLKTLSGGDMVTAEYKYKEPFTFAPRHMLLAVSNDAPRVWAYDDALRDRILAVPFRSRLDAGGLLFGGANLKDLVTDPDSPVVRGFTAWAVEGMAEVEAQQTIHKAAAARRATDALWRDIDPLSEFWEEVEDAGGYEVFADGYRTFIAADFSAGVRSCDLYTAYKAWARDNGIRMPHTHKRFGQACESVGLYRQHTKVGKVYTLPKGVTLAGPQQDHDDPQAEARAVTPGNDPFAAWLNVRVTDCGDGVTDGDGTSVTTQSASETAFSNSGDGLTLLSGKDQSRNKGVGLAKDIVFSDITRQPVTTESQAREARKNPVTGNPSPTRHQPVTNPSPDPQLITGLLTAIRAGAFDDTARGPELRRLDRDMTHSATRSPTARIRIEEAAVELAPRLVEAGYVTR